MTVKDYPNGSGIGLRKGIAFKVYTGPPIIVSYVCGCRYTVDEFDTAIFVCNCDTHPEQMVP